VIQCLADACETRTAIVQPDFGDLEEQIRTAAQGVELVFVDGYPQGVIDEQGRPFGPDCVQYLYDRRLVFPGSGGIVRVMGDPEFGLIRRRASRGGIDRWFDVLPHIEERIRLLNMPYFVIHNEPGEHGLVQAVGDLARRASINEE
jgi:hypothetical protein